MSHFLIPWKAVSKRMILLCGIHACDNTGKPLPEAFSRAIFFLAGIFREPRVVAQSIPGTHIESESWITIPVIIQKLILELKAEPLVHIPP
jgi:hypothetical protein